MKNYSIKEMPNQTVESLKERAKNFMLEERGDFSIKGIAGTVAAIVIIGLVIVLLRDSLLGDIVEYFWQHIQNIVDTMVNG